MGKIVYVPGFPEQSEEFIDFPDHGELMLYPEFAFATAEEVRKHGTSFQKELLDKAPLMNNKKYVFVICSFRYLYPGIFVNKPEFGDRNEWHSDGIFGQNQVHIIMSKGSARTEFNETPFMLEIPDEIGENTYNWLLQEGIKKEKEWGLSPRKVDSNRFVSFQNHLHRASVPDKHEFRFFFRILETDSMWDLGKSNRRFMFNSGANMVYQNKDPKNIWNIEKREDGIFIHYKR